MAWRQQHKYLCASSLSGSNFDAEAATSEITSHYPFVYSFHKKKTPSISRVYLPWWSILNKSEPLRIFFDGRLRNIPCLWLVNDVVTQPPDRVTETPPEFTTSPLAWTIDSHSTATFRRPRKVQGGYLVWEGRTGAILGSERAKMSKKEVDDQYDHAEEDSTPSAPKHSRSQ